MSENQTEAGELPSARGAAWQELLDTELDAYLDRELLAQPAPEVKPTPGVEQPAERLQGMLALAAEEQQWLRTLPLAELPAEDSKALEGGECVVPEHLKAKPASEVLPAILTEPSSFDVLWTSPLAPLPGLALAPHLAQPSPAPSRTPWLVTGALVGVSAAILLVAGMLWMRGDNLPERTQAVAAHVTAGTVTVVTPPLASPALSVKDSPLPRQLEPLPGDWSLAKAVLEPEVMARVTLPPAQRVVATGDKPREPAQARRTPAVEKLEARRDIADPVLEDTEEETPFQQEPGAALAPALVAKAPPPSVPPKKRAPSEFDPDYERELGFTDDAVLKVPESKGVKSVWIPPDPSRDIPERLTPEDIQQVVLANQPAIASCIRRNKDAIPRLSEGRFMVRWFISPGGSTYGVAMETQPLRATALATCIEGLVRDWKFPRHQLQMGPIRFPFIF